MFKLPPYTELKADGIYRYRRRVPVKAVRALGKGFLYRNLGKTKEEVMANWPKSHEEVEALFEQAKENTLKEEAVFSQKDEREKVLHLVQKHYGDEAAQQLEAKGVDENLEFALMDLADSLEGSISKKTQAMLYSGVVPDKVVSLSSVMDAYYDFKTTGKADVDKRLHNGLTRSKEDLIASLGNVKISKLPVEQLTRKDANAYRDYLLTRMTPSSVARYKNTVNAVMN